MQQEHANKGAVHVFVVMWKRVVPVPVSVVTCVLKNAGTVFVVLPVTHH